MAKGKGSGHFFFIVLKTLRTLWPTIYFFYPSPFHKPATQCTAFGIGNIPTDPCRNNIPHSTPSYTSGILRRLAGPDDSRSSCLTPVRKILFQAPDLLAQIKQQSLLRQSGGFCPFGERLSFSPPAFPLRKSGLWLRGIRIPADFGPP